MTSEQKLSIGDIVRLKSGGPLMTVASQPDQTATGPDQSVACMWFAQPYQTGAPPWTKAFPRDALERITRLQAGGDP